ncbi:MAG: hypothetical protein ACI4NE_02325 [Succinivibrio sp.]
MNAPLFIAEDSALKALSFKISELTSNDFISLDTEFNRVKTCYPSFDLLQLHFSDTTYLVDPHALDLKELLIAINNTKATFLVFSCTEDLEVLTKASRDLGLLKLLPEKIVDLQVLLAFLNLSYMQGLQTALIEYTGISLSKEETLSDWSVRPLSDTQIEYAANDVLHLEKLYKAILSKSKKDDRRLRFFECEMENIKSRALSVVSPDDAYKSVSGAGTLSSAQLNVLKYLCSKRLELARTINVAANRIITGKALCALSRQKVLNPKIMLSCQVKYGAVKQFGEYVIKWHQEALEHTNDPVDLPYDCFLCDRQYANKIRELKYILKTAAKNAEIREELLTNKALCADYFYKLHYKKEPLVQSSWIKECIGSEIKLNHD